jgi:hypothetical protein
MPRAPKDPNAPPRGRRGKKKAPETQDKAPETQDKAPETQA